MITYDVYLGTIYKVNGKKRRVVDIYLNSFKTIIEASEFINECNYDLDKNFIIIMPRWSL